MSAFLTIRFRPTAPPTVLSRDEENFEVESYRKTGTPRVQVKEDVESVLVQPLLAVTSVAEPYPIFSPRFVPNIVREALQ